LTLSDHTKMIVLCFLTLPDRTEMGGNIKRQEWGSKKTGKCLKQLAAKKDSHVGVRNTDKEKEKKGA
jgi:hypothetical protein